MKRLVLNCIIDKDNEVDVIDVINNRFVQVYQEVYVGSIDYIVIAHMYLYNLKQKKIKENYGNVKIDNVVDNLKRVLDVRMVDSFHIIDVIGILRVENRIGDLVYKIFDWEEIEEIVDYEKINVT